MPTKNSYIFICLTEDGDIWAGRQFDIDSEIKSSEIAEADLEFTVIGKIKEPVDMDFSSTQIEWYEEKERDKQFIDRAVINIINYIKNN